MLKKFEKHIATNFPFLEQSRFFIAVSGGIDSMVLVDLFQKLKFQFAMLHCNFQLRGEESDTDMKFFQEYGNKYLIPYSVGHFDTLEYAKEMKLSIQVAARDLRYEWFFEQLKEKDFDYVLTAHHADDDLETFIINLSRGTGLEGLIGIPETNQEILRPLLPFSRKDIESYATENKVQWREDSSNATDKYLRNKIRHDIVPLLKELNPNFLNSFQNTLENLHQAQSLVNDAAEFLFEYIANTIGDDIYLDIKKLKNLPNSRAYLYQWLQPYGFTAWDDIYDLMDGQSGKQVFSKEFRLLKNRDNLILTTHNSVANEAVFFIEKNQMQVKIPLKLSFCKVDDNTTIPLSAIFVDENKLKFPLVIRRFNKGDVFMPFGMNGKSKKVSKFFKDEKLSLLDKEKIWLLCSDNQIVWVIGIRQDERFRVNNNTTDILQIKVL